jgi:hypothetical protein
MTQQSLLSDLQREDRAWKRVRTTSATAYELGRESFNGRKAEVLRWLAAYWNRFNESPTSDELAQWTEGLPERTREGLDQLLYVRRAISDLQDCGVVEAVTPRKSRVSGRVCETWHVRERAT